MKINELSTRSQRKIIRNVLNCMGYIKYFNSIDDFLNEHYDDQNKYVDCFNNYLNDSKAACIINEAILKTLDSDINTRFSNTPIQYSILQDDTDLAQELISKGINVGKDEIQLAAKYGRSSILEMMLHKNPKFNKDIVLLPSSCSSARLFWAPAQRWLGYEVDYPKVERLLKK